jgi:hypothetical protein
MGLYTVVIVGEGAVGNEDTGDIDNETKGLISILKNHGHRIYDATLILVGDEGQRINLEED